MFAWMLIDPEKYIKEATYAKNKGVTRQSVKKLLDNRGIKPVIIDKVRHYNIEDLKEVLTRQKPGRKKAVNKPE